jgi:hypothetical protein
MTLNQLVIALIINGLTSLITIIGWDGTKYSNIRNQQNIIRFLENIPLLIELTITKRRYFNYQFESNGSAAVALYSIPKRITTNSFTVFAATAFQRCQS